MERTNKPSLSQQMKRHTSTPIEKENEGNFKTVISTGSTLLDLAISGTRIHGGGIPGGILVECFGPNGSGKTVLLCETAGDVQRKGGQATFKDPEARLNPQFAKIFDLDVENMTYSNPDTVNEVFKQVREWQPEGKGDVIHGVFIDSLAALSTELEMEKEAGDKMGGKRAKDFSEQLRKTCRLIKDKNWVMMCSNQVRQNMDAGPYGQKYTTPGGEAMGFYASLRLRFVIKDKIKKEITFRGKTIERVIGVTTEVEVYKSSIDKPYRRALVTIIFDYGVDDIRENLQFYKTYTKSTTYSFNDQILGRSLEEAVRTVERSGLEKELREKVIELWEDIESRFQSDRKHKQR